MNENIEPMAAMDEEYEADILTLQDEEGREHEFEVLDAADIDGVRYLALVPRGGTAESLEQDSEMIIMRVGEDDGEEYLDVVDDEDELQMAGGVFLNRLRDVYDIDLADLGLENGAE